MDRRGDVLELTLHRPEALNAFTVEMHEALSEALREAADPAIRAVHHHRRRARVLRRTGPRGGDRAGAPRGPSDRLGTYYNPNLLALRALDKPVIAAVNGAAAGAGMGLALACDVRLLAEGATFVPAFSAIGLVPDSGTSWFTVALLGYARAFVWLTSGRRMGADEALALGLADEVVPVEELLDRRAARAEALAATPGRSVELTKRLLQSAACLDAHRAARPRARAAAGRERGPGVPRARRGVPGSARHVDARHPLVWS